MKLGTAAASRQKAARKAAIILAQVTLLAPSLFACRPEAQRSALARAAQASATRLWSGSDFNFYASRPSPDGRWVTEIDWMTGDLAARDLTTGLLHRLTAKGTWQTSGDYAASAAFSPDGERVGYVWWNDDDQRHELRVLEFRLDADGKPVGSNVRTVLSTPRGAYAVHGWTADDRILGTLRRPGRTLALALVHAANGEVSILESFDWRNPRAAISPDGRFVAYDLPEDTSDPDRDIFLLSIEDGTKTVLVDDPGDDVLLGWDVDGDVLFARREGRRSAVSRLPMARGAIDGSPLVVLEDFLGRVEPLGVGGDAFYFGVVVESRTFGVAELDDASRLSTEPEPFDSPVGGRVDAWDWSRDGRHYAAAVRSGIPEAGFDIVIGSEDGVERHRFHGFGRVERLRWAPNGQSIVFFGFDDRDRPGLRALDLDSGEIRTLRRFDHYWGAMGGHFALSPDGREVYFRLLARGAAVGSDAEGSLVALDLASGAERYVRPVRGGGSVAISADGRRLAYVDRVRGGPERVVLRVSTPVGGEPRIAYRAAGEDLIDGLNWTPDGGGLVLLGGPPTEPEILRITADSGEVTAVIAGVPPQGGMDLRLHPDGRQIAFVSGENRGEIWALEGLRGVAARAEDR